MTAFENGLSSFRNNDFAGAAELFAAVPPTDANYHRAQVGLGKAFHELHDYEAAVRHFTRAAAGGYDKPQVAYAGLALALAELGRYDEAAAAMQRSIDLDPRNADALYNMGQILIRAGRHLQAAESFRRADEVRPNADYLAYCALCHSEIGDFTTATAMCEQSLARDGRSHLAHDVLAITHARRGDYAAALRHSDMAVGLCPGDAGYLFNRGCTYEALARYADAIIDYSLAIKLAPDNGKYYTNRANCHLALSDHAAAMADLDSAVRLGDPVAYFNRANLLIKLARYEEALADLNRHIPLHPNHRDAYVARSLAYSKLGRTRESEADFAQSNKVG